MRAAIPAALTAVALALTLLCGCGSPGESGHGARVTLLNVSYDPTRELYEDYNAAFARYWQAKTGQRVRIDQ